LELWEPHLSGIDSVPSLLQEAKNNAPRQLIVASTSMLLADYLVEPLRQFLAAEPSVMLSLLNEPADPVLRHVVKGEADVGVVTYLPDEPRDPQLVYQDLLELPWLQATPPRHPLSNKKQLKLTDLTEYPWIMPAQETQPRRHLDEVLRREGILDQIRVVLESRTFALTQTYVTMGLGITLWYGFDPSHPAAGLWLRPATQWFGIIPVAIVTRRGKHQPPHVEAFLQIIRRGLVQNKRVQ
jgi:LysR family cys regulon transcriptional activator